MQLLRIGAHGFARINNGLPRLVGLAEHGVRAHQPQPPFDVAAILLEPPGEAIDHPTDHGAALCGRHLVGRCHSLRCRAAHGGGRGETLQRCLETRQLLGSGRERGARIGDRGARALEPSTL